MGLLKNIFTLGGAYRLDKARARLANSQAVYQRIKERMDSVNGSIALAVDRLGRSFKRTKRELSRAHAMLHPRCLRKLVTSNELARTNYGSERTTALTRTYANGGSSSTQLAVLGASLGTSAAIIAWQGVQVIGIASTGTAIGGIYGAAASNAGWAAFGGGSLATGGGGMALGHLVLPGIGLCIAVGVSAYTTHVEADKVNAFCTDLELANNENQQTLAFTESELSKLLRAENIYDSADRRLREEIRLVRIKLRRFGWITLLYRWVRFKIKGVYYTAEELSYVKQLERAVNDFMKTFGVS